jgi:WD40 repeat protein
MPLTKQQFDEIVDLLEPCSRDEVSRLQLIRLVFFDNGSQPDIDVSGPPLIAIRRLVFALNDFGLLSNGKPALCALLEVIRDQVGSEQQARIGALQAVLQNPPQRAEFTDIWEHSPDIFISYARADSTFAERLRTDLQAAGFNVWIDRIGLKVGTPNWEDSIRSALKIADGVILIASPNSRKSKYVRDELAIAEDGGKLIYPVWASGEKWSESIPLGHGYIQNVDMRGEKYEHGFQLLIKGIEQKSLAVELETPSELKESFTTSSPASFTPRNPYKGLKAFRSEDRKDFFGRDLFVSELLDMLQTDLRFLAVIGASGSGKSSVVMAGLLPQLKMGSTIKGSENWIYLDPFVPGKHPLEALTIELAKYLPQKSLATIEGDLKDPSTRGLYRLGKQIAKGRLVVYIDQFEEVFTQTESDAERRQFIDLITTSATEYDSVVTVILTMRADFYDRPLEYGEMGALLEAHSKAILPLSLADLYNVIQKPASLHDVQLTFESGLVEEMVFSVRGEVGALPLLQFTLNQLFELREGLLLTRNAYEAMGGVKGALARHAESVYASLPDDRHRTLAQTLFMRLVQLGESERELTRRRLMISELTLDKPDETEILSTVVENFVRARLLTTDSIHGRETVEVSHEALIREWVRLQEWLKKYREDILLQNSLNSDAERWKRLGKPKAGLYRGELLQTTKDLGTRITLNALENEFVEQSLRYARTERLKQRILVGVLISLLLMMLLGGVVSFAAQFETERQNAAALGTQVAIGANARIQSVQRESSALTQAARAAINAATALAAQDIANRSLQAARSALMANGSQNALRRGDFEDAVALAVEANTIPNPSEEAYRALADATAYSWVVDRFEVPSGPSYALALSPDGRRAVAGAGDNALLLWDVDRSSPTYLQTIHRFEGHWAPVLDVTFSPDGNWLISVGSDFRVLLWNVDETSPSFGQLLVLPHGEHTSVVSSVTFSPDGSKFLTASSDKSVIMWSLEPNLPTGAQLMHRFEGDSLMLDVALTPDGRYGLFATAGHTIELWNIDPQSRDFGTLLKTLEGHTDVVRSVSVSPDGRRALSTSFDKTLILWDIDLESPTFGELIQRFQGHIGAVLDVQFNANGTTAISSSWDGALILWDLDERVGLLGYPLRTFTRHKNIVSHVTFFPDGQEALSIDENGVIYRWDTGQYGVIQRSDLGRINPVSGSIRNDLRQVAITTSASNFALVSIDPTFGTLDQVYRFEDLAAPVSGLFFSPDNSQLLSTSTDGSVALWDINETSPHFGETLHTFTGHESQATVGTFRADGKRILSASWDKTIFLWDSDTASPNYGEAIHRFVGHLAPVGAAAFSPDGTRIISGSGDTTLILWNAEEGSQNFGQMIFKFEGHTGYVNSVLFSADGRRIISASSDDSLIMWNVDETSPSFGRILHRFLGHNDEVTALSLDSGGSLLLSASKDNSLILWDANENSSTFGYMLRRFTGHSDSILTTLFGVNISKAMSVSVDGGIITWDLTPYPGGLLSWTTANRFVPELTCEQRLVYGFNVLCDENQIYPTRTPIMSLSEMSSTSTAQMDSHSPPPAEASTPVQASA